MEKHTEGQTFSLAQLAVALVIVCCICGAVVWASMQSKKHGGISRSCLASMKSAYSAFMLAEQYKDAGVLLFEARYILAEKTIQDFASSEYASDRVAKAEAENCIRDLRLYRESIGSRDLTLRADEAVRINACKGMFYGYIRD